MGKSSSSRARVPQRAAGHRAYPVWFYVIHGYFAGLWLSGLICVPLGAATVLLRLLSAAASPPYVAGQWLAISLGTLLALGWIAVAADLFYVLVVCPAATVRITDHGLCVKSVFWGAHVPWEALAGYAANVLLVRTFYGGFPIPAVATVVLWDRRAAGGSGRAVFYSAHRDYRGILDCLARKTAPVPAARF